MLKRNHERLLICKEKSALTCSYTNTLISVAGRGKLCNHFQCFDLLNFLTMNKSLSSSWKCPICKRRSVELVRD